MLEFVLFCIPTILSVFICMRGRGRALSEALERAGVAPLEPAQTTGVQRWWPCRTLHC